MTSKCSTDCTSTTPLTRSKDTIKCNGVCGNVFHDVCSGLPRGFVQSKFVETIRKYYMCSSCKYTCTSLTQRMDAMETELSTKIDDLSEALNKLIGDSKLRHGLLSEELDNFDRKLNNIDYVKDFGKLSEKIGKAATAVQCNDIADTINSMKSSIVAVQKAAEHKSVIEKDKGANAQWRVGGQNSKEKIHRLLSTTQTHCF